MRDLSEKISAMLLLLIAGAGTIAFVSVMIAIIKSIWASYIL